MARSDLAKPRKGRSRFRPVGPSGVARQQARPSEFTSPAPVTTSLSLDIAALILAGLALFAVLKLDLLPALLSGLLIFELVHLLALRTNSIGVTRRTGKVIALTVLASLIILAVLLGIVGLVSLMSKGPESLAVLLQKMAEVIETGRSRLPSWAWSYLPADTDALKVTASAWLREHAGQLRTIGQDVWKVVVHIVIGMVIGGMIAVSAELQPHERGPLTQAFADRARHLGEAFRRVVFAQVRIAAINTVLTGVYLLIILPLFGITLPLAKTVVAVTFVMGLLPIVGNLITNTVIVVVSLSVSLTAAISSLAFLVLVHKLEYFVNARIMGGQIHSRAWELLLVMLVMDAAFGISGVIAAPIYYAYMKAELSVRGLV